MAWKKGSGFSYSLHRDEHRGRPIRLDGVPQIPEDVHRIIQDAEFLLTPEQIERASLIIWSQAAPEIRRRHEARLEGGDLDDYFEDNSEPEF